MLYFLMTIKNGKRLLSVEPLVKCNNNYVILRDIGFTDTIDNTEKLYFKIIKFSSIDEYYKVLDKINSKSTQLNEITDWITFDFKAERIYENYYVEKINNYQVMFDVSKKEEKYKLTFPQIKIN